MRTVEIAPRGRRPPIRLRPVPALDPPFDDELAPEVWAGAQQLSFDWSTSTATGGDGTTGGGATPDSTVAGSSTLGGHGSLGGHGAVAGHGAGSAGAVSGPALAGASVEAKLAVRRFVRACVEVINGYRPAAHLRRLARPGEATGVVAQALAATKRAAEIRQGADTRRRAATGSAIRPSRRGRGPAPVAVLQSRLCEPLPGVVEAAVVLVTGERTWALAVRLERHQQCWLATTLRLV